MIVRALLKKPGVQKVFLGSLGELVEPGET